MWEGGLGTLLERRVLGRRALASVALAALVAGGAGFALAGVAGGRRAATSYDRLLEWSAGGDVVIGGLQLDSSEEADRWLRAVTTFPGVVGSSRNILLGDGVELAGTRLPFLSILPVAFESSLGNVKLVEGRLPDVADPDQAAVTFDAGDRFGIDVGDEVTIVFEQGDASERHTVRVTGRIAAPGTFPSTSRQPIPAVILTPAFLAAHAERADWTNGSAELRLEQGRAGVGSFREVVAEQGVPVDQVASVWDDASGVRRLVRIEAAMWWIIAAAAASATAVVCMQALRREAASVAPTLSTLGAMGLTRRAAIRGGFRHGALVGTAGAIGACAVAVALSNRFPVGLGGVAEPHPGFHADLAVLGVGFVAIPGVVGGLGAAAVALATRRRSVRVQRVGWSALPVGALPPVVATGTRLALGAPAQGTTRVRLGLAGLGTLLSMTAITFCVATSFGHLLDEPRLAGNPWDVTLVYDDDGPRELAAVALASDGAIDDFVRGGWSDLLVNGEPVFTVALEASARLQVATDRGRAPGAADEIALGSVEMERLGVGIGDVVEVALPPDGAEPPGTPRTVAATVTGRSVLGSPRYRDLRPGEGGAVTVGLIQQLDPSARPIGYFVRLREPDPLLVTGAALAERHQPNFWFERADRAGVGALDGLRRLPFVLVGLFGVLTLASLTQLLVSTGLASRRTVAVLRSLGFTKGQVVRTGGVHGATATLAATLFAASISAVAAVVMWRVVADYLDVVPEPVVPVAVWFWGAAALTVAGAALGAVSLTIVERHRAISSITRE